MYTTKLLKTFDWHSPEAFLLSLVPSIKYQIIFALTMISLLWGSISISFGLNNTAFAALFVVFVTELVSGITAALVKREKLSSLKLSRFVVKATCYLVLIWVTYSFYTSFTVSKDDCAAVLFDWLHIFLVIQIVFENIISILENVAVIGGKDKTALIQKLTEKLNSIFG